MANYESSTLDKPCRGHDPTHGRCQATRARCDLAERAPAGQALEFLPPVLAQVAAPQQATRVVAAPIRVIAANAHAAERGSQEQEIPEVDNRQDCQHDVPANSGDDARDDGRQENVPPVQA